ncbi:hypothetical protein WG66_012807, partial [Moniliophthora roreri]
MNGTSQDAQKCIETAICRLMVSSLLFDVGVDLSDHRALDSFSLRYSYHGWPFILITESTNNLLLKQSHVTLGASIARGTQKQWYLLKYIDNSLP